MLNAVARLVIRDALVEELNDERGPRPADVTIAVGEMLVVVGSGPRGNEHLRKRWLKRRASLGIGRFVVEGDLGYPGDTPLIESSDPAIVLANRDLLVPMTDAEVTYDRLGTAVTETFPTVLVNRARRRGSTSSRRPRRRGRPVTLLSPAGRATSRTSRTASP
jgi:hypothetical protein